MGSKSEKNRRFDKGEERGGKDERGKREVEEEGKRRGEVSVKWRRDQ